ncbi:YusU family protein [Bacillus sp. CGMCC 1.16541]|uniref:YusU family protein n=1 Tax=Bacillus sp. CGMCC 1.16541 TaxID=2185143 RepID=UPI000D7383FF|nr:YusU family protein [Bacillus sp. CGMCC 1.16541]
MDQKLKDQFDGLLEKYTELMVGESSEELKEKVQMWALYTYIAKTMPALAKHWNETYPDGKTEMMNVIREIKELNDKHRSKR